jgi:hypothetical protein
LDPGIANNPLHPIIGQQPDMLAGCQTKINQSRGQRQSPFTKFVKGDGLVLPSRILGCKSGPFFKLRGAAKLSRKQESAAP